MANYLIKPLLLSVLAILVSNCFATHPCSSYKTSTSDILSTLSQFPDGCLLDAHDNLSLPIPINSLQKQASLLNIYLELNSPNDKVQLNVLPDLSADSYKLEAIHGENSQKHIIPSSQEVILFEISNGAITFADKNSPSKVLQRLNESSPYIFKVSVSESGTPLYNPFLGEKNSFRILNQCPEGFFLVDGACMRVCPNLYYRYVGLCWKCPDNCHKCLSDKKCNPCKDNQVYFEEKSICLDTCPETYFEDYNNKICVKCSEGCTSCSYPNGLCSASYFKTDMIINLAVSLTLIGCITLCACFCNKEKSDKNKTTEGQQAEQDAEGENQKGQKKGKSEHIKKMIGANPAAPYNALQEVNDFDNEDSGDATDKKKRKRLSDFAKSRLLSVSMSKKAFMVDDSNEEKAISHGSGSKLHSKLSISYLPSKADSPLFKAKMSAREDSRIISQSLFSQELQDGKQYLAVDNLLGNNQSYSEMASPLSGLSVKRDTSLGVAMRKFDNKDSILNLNQAEAKAEGEGFVETVDEAIELDEEEKKEKEGYKSDLSVSMSKDKEGLVDYASCTICCMNKRDCLNKPCGHVIGCYACMQQFRESYGVCPRCKKLLTGIERVTTQNKQKNIEKNIEETE